MRFFHFGAYKTLYIRKNGRTLFTGRSFARACHRVSRVV